MDDTDLTARLATDVDGAFEALVRAHVDRLYSIALRLTGDASDAEEIAQDVLVRAYRALGTYDGERIRALRLRPWLAAIAVNLSRNRRRRIADRLRPLPLTALDDAPARAPLASSGDAPEAVAIRRAELDRWRLALGSLPERYRVPIVLRHVDDLSYQEMAETLGRPEGTLKAQVHRGLTMLRAAWEAGEREELTA